MRKNLSLLLLAGFLAVSPLAAKHKHGRGCGHYYQPQRGWLSIEVFGRNGGFAYRQGPSPYGYGPGYGPNPYRYYQDGYYDGRRSRSYCHRSCRHHHRHVYYHPSYHGRGHSPYGW